MAINKKLLTIKFHFFFCYASISPIYPQLSVFGKELGISPVVMGTVNAIIPILIFLAKPFVGIIIDVCRSYRKCIFIGVIVTYTLFLSGLYFIQPEPPTILYGNFKNLTLQDCNVTEKDFQCNSGIIPLLCNSNCSKEPLFATYDFQICTKIDKNLTCDLICVEHTDIKSRCFYKTFTFWVFIIFMAVGAVTSNVIGCLNDTVCYEIIGKGGDYGRQRVWGALGYGTTALISGFVCSLLSIGENLTYTPAFAILVICAIISIGTCSKLQLPVIESPKNMFKLLKNLLKNASTAIFLLYVTFAGILNSVTFYFLFWYFEDLTNVKNIKLIEGFSIAAETLGSEILFFYISGNILKRFGHVVSFSACFIFYSIRFAFIAWVSSPWWVVVAQLCFSGPAFALARSAIVAHANELAPSGASASMQGITAGVNDGFGVCVGSFIAGYLYKYIGAKPMFYIFSLFAFLCGVSHSVLHKTLLRRSQRQSSTGIDYRTPQEAFGTTK